MELLTKIDNYLKETMSNAKFSPKTRIALKFTNIKVSLEDLHNLKRYIDDVKNYEKAQKDEGFKVLFQLGINILHEPMLQGALDINFEDEP